jgi:hypothetical protein
MNIKEVHTQEKPVSAISLFKSDQGNATAIQILQGEKLKRTYDQNTSFTGMYRRRSDF